MVENVDIAQFRGLTTTGDVLVVDVRTAQEYEAGHVPGALFMPLHTVPLRATELVSQGKPIYLICETGNRSWHAAAFLAQHGITATNVAGGTSAWRTAGHPIERGAAA